MKRSLRLRIPIPSLAGLAILLILVGLCLVQQAESAATNYSLNDSQQMYAKNGSLVAKRPLDVLNDTKYAAMRQEFLNLDPVTLSEINLNELTTEQLTTVLNNQKDVIDLRWDENGVTGWEIYGSKFICNNKDGHPSLCFRNTGGLGGEQGIDNPQCGSYTSNSIENANDPTYQCQTPNSPWYNMNFWLGTNNNNDFIVDNFYPDGYQPVNRLCVEMEFPADKLSLTHPAMTNDFERSQLVNPSVLHENLRQLIFHWGSYTSPRRDDLGTTSDEEVGGTYQNGGSNFSHNGTASTSYPSDRIYALDESTFVACMGNRPAGVRTGMRMPYAWEPLATIGGVDDSGEPNGLSYFNHLTRIYFRIQNSVTGIANYPLDLKINKLFMLYEDNDIFAATSDGKVVSEKIVANGESADHPFTIYNNAPEARTYRVFLFNRDALPLITSAPHYTDNYLLIDDLDGDGVADEGEPLIAPYALMTLPANTDKKLIIRHRAEFDGWYGSYDRHGTRMTQASFAIQELGTLRSAGIHTRLWEGTPTDQQNETAFLAAKRYPSDTNEWYTQRQFNSEKTPATNPHLLRNTRDYQMAKQKGGW